MVVARLKSDSVARLAVAFIVITLLLSLEARGPWVSKAVFLAMPGMLAFFSSSESIARVIYFIAFFEVMLVMVFWPVSLFSKALLLTSLFWYLVEFPQRAFANLALGIMVAVIAIVSAPVTQQF